MTIDGVSAIVTYDPDIDLFRGEFTGHAAAVHAAAASGKSLNQFVVEVIKRGLGEIA